MWAQFEVDYTVDGSPAVTVYNGFPGPERPPDVSLSHVWGSAVAVASRKPVGIDLEWPGRIRDAAAVASIALCESERVFLDQTLLPGETEQISILWSIKEAAAKSIDSGLVGNERKFRIESYSCGNQSAEVVYENRIIPVQIRKVGDFICALAFGES